MGAAMGEHTSSARWTDDVEGSERWGVVIERERKRERKRHLHAPRRRTHAHNQSAHCRLVRYKTGLRVHSPMPLFCLLIWNPSSNGCGIKITGAGARARAGSVMIAVAICLGPHKHTREHRGEATKSRQKQKQQQLTRSDTLTNGYN